MDTTPVNKEAVKILAQTVGLREAARRMNLSEERVLKWSQRDPEGPWSKQPATLALSTPTVTGATLQQASPHTVLKPSQALANWRESKKGKIQSNLVKYLVNGSKTAAKSRKPLEDAHNVKALAGVYSAMFPEQQQPGVSINLWGASGME